METKRNVYALLLAGGSGERLWPLSRRNSPKQFLPLKDHSSLLQDTIERISPLIPFSQRWVVTTAHQADDIAAHISSEVGLISVEPTARNTGPAVLLNCLAIYEMDPTAIVVIVPTDHHIAPHKTFIEFLTHAIDSAQEQERIILLGATPTYAAQGYGYIEYEKGTSLPYRVTRFHEKPDAQHAQEYLNSDSMLWNIGISCAQVSVMIREFEITAPLLYDAVKGYWQDHQPYEAIPALSLDHAVLEKSKRISVFPVSFRWCDVGSLTTYLSLNEQYNKQEMPHVVSIDSQNNLVNVKQDVVALIGVENMCIVQTDDVLLIARRDETEKVRQVLEKLKNSSFDDYL